MPIARRAKRTTTSGRAAPLPWCCAGGGRGWGTTGTGFRGLPSPFAPIPSPHGGTVHARFGAGANARQMMQASEFLRTLCEEEAAKAPACAVTSIYTPHDNLVAPQETSRLPWARNIAIPGRGHVDILAS